MFSETAFLEAATELARVNHLPLETAEEFLSLIGDTPELADDGRVIVRDASSAEIGRVILPVEE
jgi:hypothetical protein